MDIDYLCQLAHIELANQEKEIIAKDIEKIISFFSKIQELNIQTEEYYYPNYLGETKYNQQIKNEIDFNDFLENNSIKEQSYFKTPPILKK